MNTMMLQDLAMQNVETVRRAAERSARGLRSLGQNGEAVLSRGQAVREFLADSQADLASLRVLRKVADEILSDGIETEALRHFCEIALEAANITRAGTALLENSKTKPNVAELENGEQFCNQIRQNLEQAQALYSYFHRLVEWLRTSSPPLERSALEKLHSLPPVTVPENKGIESASGY